MWLIIGIIAVVILYLYLYEVAQGLGVSVSNLFEVSEKSELREQKDSV